MKRVLLGVCVVIGLAVTSARAADPDPQSESPSADKKTTTAAAEVAQPVIAQRELKFDVSDEQHPLPLAVAGPYKLEQLLDNKYVARFTLVSTMAPDYYDPRDRSWTFTSPHFDGSMAGRADDSTKGSTAASLNRLHERLFSTGGPLYPQTFKELLGRMPPERRPSEDVARLLTTTPSLHVKRSPTSEGLEPGPGGERPRGPHGEPIWHCNYEVRAPTAEVGRELVEGLLTLSDYGLFLPFQQECLRGKRAFEEDAAKARADLKQILADQAACVKELDGLEGYKDVGNEAVAKFTAQIRLISVDMAGVQARLDACDKILAARPDRPNPARTYHVETLKITAEIELVGLVARKASLEEIAKKGQRRNELVRREISLARSVSSKQRRVADAEKGIAHYKAQRLRVVPYTVKDGKVTIRRIKWESSEKPDAGGEGR